MSSGTDARALVRVCDTCADAEDLITRLQSSGCDMRTLSIAGRNVQREGLVTGFYATGDRMKFWGTMDAFWAGVWGIFAGSACFLIPGVGPVMIGGPLVAAIASALERSAGVGGMSVLGAGLCALGVPKNGVDELEAELREDKVLLIVPGPAASSARARDILSDGKTLALSS